MLSLLTAALMMVSPSLNVTVPTLDVGRYLGTWYEIARFPSYFERGCVGTTATYSLRSDGDIEVLNRCVKGSLQGKLKEAKGKAWVPNPSEPGKLKVQFFWPFRGDYWVVELGENYQYSVVGNPDFDYCWILSRTPTLPAEVYEGIVSRLKERGYPVERFERVPQAHPSK